MRFALSPIKPHIIIIDSHVTSHDSIPGDTLREVVQLIIAVFWKQSDREPFILYWHVTFSIYRQYWQFLIYSCSRDKQPAQIATTTVRSPHRRHYHLIYKCVLTNYNISEPSSYCSTHASHRLFLLLFCFDKPWYNHIHSFVKHLLWNWFIDYSSQLDHYLLHSSRDTPRFISFVRKQSLVWCRYLSSSGVIATAAAI